MELLEAKKIEQKDFRRIFQQATDCSPNTAARFFQPNAKPIDKSDLCLICSLFGFKPEDFGYPHDLFTTEYSGSKEAEVHSYNFKEEGNKEYRPYIENFFRSVREHLLTAEKSVHICDYIAKMRGISQKEHLKFFNEQDALYYRSMEARLAEKQFLYQRIVQLPLGVDITDFEEAVAMVVDQLFPDMVRHFYHCLVEHHRISHFYVILRPYRLYTYYISDRKTIMTEYPRFDKNGIPIPDLFFVNHQNPFDAHAVGSKYIDSCLDEFERAIQHPNNIRHRLTPTFIVRALYHLKKNAKQEIERLEAEKNAERANIKKIFESGLSIDEKQELVRNLPNIDAPLNEAYRRFESVKQKLNLIDQVT